MPTPSETQRKSEFGLGQSPPRRSVFGNYKVERQAELASTGATEPRVVPDLDATPLQSSIDTALARTFIYRLLAKAYEDPELEGWKWLSSDQTKSALESAGQAFAPFAPPSVSRCAAELANRFAPEGFDDFLIAYVTCFGHTVRGDCPMNEIEYSDIKADPLFQPHRLADLGAFYAAFGLEMTPAAAQRQDHVSIECEFMSVLAAKEAYAREHQLDDERALCREAQKKFLREHLGRWIPAFSRRLARMAHDTALGALADFTREFITEDCARFQVAPGSEDLLLRPIDAASESLCATCGITNLPPGAMSLPMEG